MSGININNIDPSSRQVVEAIRNLEKQIAELKAQVNTLGQPSTETPTAPVPSIQPYTYRYDWLVAIPSEFNPTDHDASKIVSGEFPFARLPISATEVANWNTAYDSTISAVSGDGNSVVTFTRIDEVDLTVDLSHSHTIAEVTGLQSALDAKIPLTQKGIANGVATLDSNTKIPLNQIPDSIIGQVEYQGTWNASTDTPTLPDASTVKGHYYVTSTAGTYGSDSFQIGDWVISDGVKWDKVDNTDAVQSVAGRTGAVTLSTADIESGEFSYARLPISSTQVSNWDTAYGWGDHSTAGYAKTASDIGLGSVRNVSSYSQTEADSTFTLWGPERSANCASGWVTIADFTNDRGYGEFFIWDTESGDHSFLHLEAVRSYNSSTITVLSNGGHQRRITGVRFIEDSSDVTYGNKKLQVYVTAESVYNVRHTDINKLAGFTTVQPLTPVTDNLVSGYQLAGREVENLNHQRGSIATTGEVHSAYAMYVNGNAVYHEGNPPPSGEGTTYTAGDGLTLESDAFSVDGTVTRTAGSRLGKYIYLDDYDDGNVSTGFRTYVRNSTWYFNADVSNTTGNAQIELSGHLVWNAGNDGSGSGLDADLLDGYHATASATTDTVVVRNGSGDINCRLVRPNYNDQVTIAGAIAYRVDNGSNNYIRFCSNMEAVRDHLEAAVQLKGVDFSTNKTLTYSNYLARHTHTSSSIRDLTLDLPSPSSSRQSFEVWSVGNVFGLVRINRATGTTVSWATAYSAWSPSENVIIPSGQGIRFIPVGGIWWAERITTGMYMGSTRDETEYPVGSSLYMLVYGGGTLARNQQVVVNHNSTYGFINYGPAGPELAGEWRARGCVSVGSGNYAALVERVK